MVLYFSLFDRSVSDQISSESVALILWRCVGRFLNHQRRCSLALIHHRGKLCWISANFQHFDVILWCVERHHDRFDAGDQMLAFVLYARSQSIFGRDRFRTLRPMIALDSKSVLSHQASSVPFSFFLLPFNRIFDGKFMSIYCHSCFTILSRKMFQFW